MVPSDFFKSYVSVSYPSFFEALRYWFKLGFISFGGPAGQISLMHQELVERRRWISEGRFLHALNYTMVLPGPEAQQLATYMGWLMHGTWGGIAAGSLFVLPSLFLLILLSWVYLNFGDVSWVQGILYGIKPAVTAIVLFAAYRIGKRALNQHWLKVIALLAFVAIFILDIPFPLIILSAAAIGFFGHKYFSQYFLLPAAKDEKVSSTNNSALIDDDSPLPDHIRNKKFAWVRWLLIGLGLWCIGIATLIILFGWQNTLTQMAWFFSKAAMLTFGGAYAVLPYVYQGGVEHYQWLSAAQMIDGLALGETTPGPLIMVVAFIGFVGAWGAEIFGGNQLLLAGMIGACVVTFFTFLPSFLFIFIGAPLVEATRDNIKLSAPLTAITAAVVGVIINLALFFAYHVLWPQGFSGSFEWIAAGIGFLAFIALFKFDSGIMPVIAACALLGLIYSLFI